MMRRLSIFSLFVLLTHGQLFAQLKLMSPNEFLGYELGERFTRHHQVVSYFQHVDAAMGNVSFQQYGETNEHRPLIYAVVTAPENFKDVETIRTDNLKRAGMLEGAPSSLGKKAIVWLSYNVHGNEASGMEAAMLTLYELCNPQNAKTQMWLKNTVVILDPCINPDGRDRYANFYNQYGNAPYNMSEDAMEHHEPWPDGRENHYMFDLNRDWAWATQVETQFRLKVYNEWLPHVHVDFHEQGYNRPYYFAPAAEPFHEVITPWQRKFQTMIGKNHAKYFDEKGWLYFTKEIFDLYYPSYGDTYPTYSGAIGMTYEQGGGGHAGLGVRTAEDDPLTLKDRLLHHHTTGLSTIEIASQQASTVVDEFEKYFKENINSPVAPYKTYVIKNDNSDKISRLLHWMDVHQIRYGHAPTEKSMTGYDYQTQKNGSFNLTMDDIVVNIYQPKSRFISAVFEPKSKLSDSLTYDITAWNLIYAYDLRAYAVAEKIALGRPYAQKPVPAPSTGKPYAYLFRYKTLDDATFAAALMKAGIKVRVAQRAFSTNGMSFDPGTLIITRRNNEGIADFDGQVIALATLTNRQVYSTTTGFVDKGKDLGSADVSYLRAPKVAMVFGDQTSSLSAGEVWHFFEKELVYPITHIGTSYFKNTGWRNYNVLIVPDGRYRLFDDAMLGELSEWVSAGGRLIVIGDALSVFADKKSFGLKRFASEEEKEKAETIDRKKMEKEQLTRFEDYERKELSRYIFGAIYRVDIDNSHPLAFGLPSTYYSLKTSEQRFAFLENGWNVGIIKGKTAPIQGFAGYAMNKKLENSLVFGVEEKGSGKVIYMIDNPLFRDFWINGKLIFANAVFMN